MKIIQNKIEEYIFGFEFDEKYLIEKILDFFDISENSLKRASRVQRLVFARACLSRLLTIYGFTSIKIGQYLNRDHSTILYYLEIFDTDFKLKNVYNELLITIANDLANNGIKKNEKLTYEQIKAKRKEEKRRAKLAEQTKKMIDNFIKNYPEDRKKAFEIIKQITFLYYPELQDFFWGDFVFRENTQKIK